MLRKSTKQPKKKSEDLSQFEVTAEFVKPIDKVVGSDSREEDVEDDFSDLDVTLNDGLDQFNSWDDDGASDQVYGFDPGEKANEELDEEPLEEIQEERITGLTEDQPEKRSTGRKVADRWKIVGFGNANAGTTKKVKDEDPKE